MPKRNLKASLVRYARVEGKGWRRGSIITSRNGRVKNDAMLMGGREYSIDSASPYQVRYKGGVAERTWTCEQKPDQSNARTQSFNGAFVSSVVERVAFQPENATKTPPALGVAADGRKVSLSPECQK